MEFQFKTIDKRHDDDIVLFYYKDQCIAIKEFDMLEESDADAYLDEHMIPDDVETIGDIFWDDKCEWNDPIGGYVLGYFTFYFIDKKSIKPIV